MHARLKDRVVILQYVEFGVGFQGQSTPISATFLVNFNLAPVYIGEELVIDSYAEIALINELTAWSPPPLINPALLSFSKKVLFRRQVSSLFER